MLSSTLNTEQLDPQLSVSRNALDLDKVERDIYREKYVSHGGKNSIHNIQEYTHLGKVPFLVAERTDGTGLQPALDAIQVKDVSTIAEGNAESIVVGGRRIGLVFDGGFVEGIAANGALS